MSDQSQVINTDLTETEPKDMGEASETLESPSQESSPDPEIISPPSSETMKRWKVFAQEIVASGIISTEEYESFSNTSMQSENAETIDNKTRRKQIEEIEQASNDPDLSPEQKSELKTKLKRLQVDQAYSDFLFVKQNLHRLSSELSTQSETAGTVTQKMEAQFKRKSVLLELSNLFNHYKAYMDSLPDLIEDFINDSPEQNRQYIVHLNLELYTELGKIKDDMSTQSEAQTQILTSLAEQATYISPELIQDQILDTDHTIELLKQQISKENAAASTPETAVTKPSVDAPDQPSSEKQENAQVAETAPPDTEQEFTQQPIEDLISSQQDVSEQPEKQQDIEDEELPKSGV